MGVSQQDLWAWPSLCAHMTSSLLDVLSKVQREVGEVVDDEEGNAARIIGREGNDGARD